MPVDQHVYLVDLLPCPLCGSHDLDAGLQASQCYGVKCRNCRLSLERHLPDKWPKGVFKRNAKYSENRLALCKWLMNGSGRPMESENRDPQLREPDEDRSLPGRFGGLMKTVKKKYAQNVLVGDEVLLHSGEFGLVFLTERIKTECISGVEEIYSHDDVYLYYRVTAGSNQKVRHSPKDKIDVKKGE